MVKRCIWATDSKDQHGDPPKCTLVDRVPKIVRTGDFTEDEARDKRRKAFIYMVKTLWEHPEECENAQTTLLNRLVASQKNTDPLKFDSVSTLGKVDTAWLAAFIADLMHISRAQIELAIDYDEDALKQLLQYLVGLPLCTRLPEACVWKPVLKQFFQDRIALLGKRHTKLNTDGVNFIHSGTGKMSWGSKGVFAFQWDDEAGKATQIIHQPTGCTATPPAHVNITKLFQIQSNWNDHTAVCFLGPAKMVMKDFFAKNQGPHLVTQLAPKEVKQFIEAIYEKYLDDTKKLKSTVDEEDFVTMAPPSKKAKTAAAAERVGPP